MAGAKNHDYHILPPDIWPLIGAISAVTFTSGMVLFMHEMPNHWLVLGLGVAGLIATFFSWFSNVVKEAQAGRSHAGRAAAPALRHDPVHRLGSDVLRRLVLVVVRFRAVPQRR